MLAVLRLTLQGEVIMGILHNSKEKSENLTRKKRMKRSEEKKKRPKKGEKNKPLLQLTIPSRRRKGKK